MSSSETVSSSSMAQSRAPFSGKMKKSGTSGSSAIASLIRISTEGLFFLADASELSGRKPAMDRAEQTRDTAEQKKPPSTKAPGRGSSDRKRANAICDLRSMYRVSVTNMRLVSTKGLGCYNRPLEGSCRPSNGNAALMTISSER